MEYYYMTDTGKVRDHNEDSVVITENMNKEILLTVADGMGGNNAGEVASSIAITHIGKRFRELSSVGNKEDAINWLKETVNETSPSAARRRSSSSCARSWRSWAT